MDTGFSYLLYLGRFYSYPLGHRRGDDLITFNQSRLKGIIVFKNFALNSRFLRTGFCFVLGATALMPRLVLADAKAGEAIAKAGVAGVPACMTCHGAQGEGQAAAAYPRLAGLSSAYLAKQLQDFKARRPNPIMQPFAQKLTDAQITDLADYYASLPAKPSASLAPATTTSAAAAPSPTSGVTSTAPATNISRGAQLAQRGNWDKGMPACIACHGDKAQGIAPHFPALAGQNANYMSKQLSDWQTGARNNDPQGLMKAVAEKLSRDDISAVSAYLEHLQ